MYKKLKMVVYTCKEWDLGEWRTEMARRLFTVHIYFLKVKFIKKRKI